MTQPTSTTSGAVIPRYKIGYRSDEWGMRSSTPSGIPDHAGAWVRYEDHIAALVDAQQPAPSAAVALSDDLRDRLVAISEAVAYQDDRAAQAMLREILAAPPADSHPAPVLLSDEELCQIEEPYLLNFRIPLGGQYDFARAVEKAVLAKTYGTQAPQPSPTPQADGQSVLDSIALMKVVMRADEALAGRCTRGTTNWAAAIGKAVQDAVLAARAPADSVTAPAGGEAVTDDMVLAALRVQYPAAYDQYLRHPANGPKTSLRAESEIDTARRMIVAALSVAPTPPAQAADSVLEDADPIRALIGQHAAILAQNESAYFELCYHRTTGWMSWITDKPLCMPPVVNPDRKVLAQGQGDTADEACRDAARRQGGA